MKSDATVTARMILDAIAELDRRGSEQMLRTLEQIEPELASFTMERLSLLHGKLIALGGPPKRTARVLRQVETTVLVCIMALRTATYQAWLQSVEGTPLADMDAPEDSPSTESANLPTRQKEAENPEGGPDVPR